MPSIQTRFAAQSVLIRMEGNDRVLKATGGGIFLQILMALLPMLVNCVQPDDGSDAKNFLKDNDNQRTRRRVAFRARVAARRRGERISRRQSMEMADAVLHEVDDMGTGELSILINENSGQDDFGVVTMALLDDDEDGES